MSTELPLPWAWELERALLHALLPALISPTNSQAIYPRNRMFISRDMDEHSLSTNGVYMQRTEVFIAWVQALQNQADHNHHALDWRGLASNSVGLLYNWTELIQVHDAAAPLVIGLIGRRVPGIPEALVPRSVITRTGFGGGQLDLLTMFPNTTIDAETGNMAPDKHMMHLLWKYLQCNGRCLGWNHTAAAESLAGVCCCAVAHLLWSFFGPIHWVGRRPESLPVIARSLGPDGVEQPMVDGSNAAESSTANASLTATTSSWSDNIQVLASPSRIIHSPHHQISPALLPFARYDPLALSLPFGPFSAIPAHLLPPIPTNSANNSPALQPPAQTPPRLSSPTAFRQPTPQPAGAIDLTPLSPTPLPDSHSTTPAPQSPKINNPFTCREYGHKLYSYLHTHQGEWVPMSTLARELELFQPWVSRPPPPESAQTLAARYDKLQKVFLRRMGDVAEFNRYERAFVQAEGGLLWAKRGGVNGPPGEELVRRAREEEARIRGWQSGE